MSPHLPVAELFGPTVQGEGPSLGRRASFLRLGGCNLRCSWCDTPYTWDASRHQLREEITPRPVADILTMVASHGTPLTVITGGEPLLHQHRPAWPLLLTGLTGDIEIETNGTITPTPATIMRISRFNVSPKLAHAGGPEPRRIRPQVLRALAATGRAAFKFVATTPTDLHEVRRVCDTAGIPPHMVWIMPEGTDPAALTTSGRALAGPAIAAGFNVTTRLHTLLWANQRGH